MTNEAREEELVLKIRKLAGELGSLMNELENAADADNYDFQVQVGLAHSVTSILEFNVDKVFKWFGYCLIGHGVELDARVEALLDSLEREVYQNIENQEEVEDPKDGPE